MFQNYGGTSNGDETLERLVAMTNQTNLVALDKSLAAIRRAPGSYAAATARVGSIAERIVRAAHEVGMTLPVEHRASSYMIKYSDLAESLRKAEECNIVVSITKNKAK